MSSATVIENASRERQDDAAAGNSTEQPAASTRAATHADDLGDAILRVNNLAVHFGAVRAVEDISFELREGETLSIIGPNGSGKTSTINLLSGELLPRAGSVVLEDRVITGQSPDRIARAGLRRTFQNGRVFANASIEDNVLVGQTPLADAHTPLPRLRRVPVLGWLSLIAEVGLALLRPPALRREEEQQHTVVGEQLARFGERLSPRRKNPALSLSYANRRRTEIARALASNPRVLLLDEPTAGMNPAETDEVLDQLLELKAEGQSMILVEHKLDLVMTLSDRVIVMDGGRIIAEGTPAEVQKDPKVIAAYLGTKRKNGNNGDK